MRKKTEPQTQQHPKTSRAGASKKGLIAKEENTPRSAREECALDDRSHRTKRISGEPAAPQPEACGKYGRGFVHFMRVLDRREWLDDKLAKSVAFPIPLRCGYSKVPREQIEGQVWLHRPKELGKPQ